MSANLTGACIPSTYNPSIFGAKILDIQANLVQNYSVNVNEAFRYTQPSVKASNLTFCNITVSYTHLSERPVKALIKSFYGKGPDFSYWNGCSRGGRQGLMLAQRYPEAYDGIAAAAPAIHWTELFPSIMWPQQVMNNQQAHPQACEFQAITAAAIATFDPSSVVGQPATTCANGTAPITAAAAAIMNTTWTVMTTKTGHLTFPGPFPGAQLTSDAKAVYGQTGILDTKCGPDGSCVGAPSLLGQQWLQLFVAKDPSWDFANVTHDEFDRLVHMSSQQYASMLGTADADLSAFERAGGKLVVFHGLTDNIIPTRSSTRYHAAVARLHPSTPIASFFRLFEVPGLAHCSGGPSMSPTHLFGQLRAWVENGTAPVRSPIKVNAKDGQVHERVLCAYPMKARLVRCDDPAVEECWGCVGG